MPLALFLCIRAPRRTRAHSRGLSTWSTDRATRAAIQRAARCRRAHLPSSPSAAGQRSDAAACVGEEPIGAGAGVQPICLQHLLQALQLLHGHRHLGRYRCWHRLRLRDELLLGHVQQGGAHAIASCARARVGWGGAACQSGAHGRRARARWGAGMVVWMMVGGCSGKPRRATEELCHAFRHAAPRRSCGSTSRTTIRRRSKLGRWTPERGGPGRWLSATRYFFFRQRRADG